MVDLLYPLIVRAAVGGTVLLAIAVCAIALTHQPARRVRLIELTLLALVVMPLVSLVPGLPQLPIWRVFHFEPETKIVVDEEIAFASDIAFNLREGDALAEPPIEVAEFLAIPTNTYAPVAVDGFRYEIVRSDEPRHLNDDKPQLNAGSAGASPSRTESSSMQLGPPDLRLIVVAAYLGGVAAMGLWSLIGSVAVPRLMRHARPAGEACESLLRDISGTTSSRIALKVSPLAGQPCAVAWWPTTIVLPAGLELDDNGARQEMRWTLAHEWSHLSRGDVWLAIAASIVRGLYFYQPLVWLLRRQLQLAQDHLADDAAARAGTAAEDYAEFLTSCAARFSTTRLAPGLGILSRTTDIERRIVMLVNPTEPLEAKSSRRWNLAVAPVAATLVALAAIVTWTSQPEMARSDEPAQSAVAPSAFAPPTVVAPAADPQSVFAPHFQQVPIEVQAPQSPPDRSAPFRKTAPSDVMSPAPGRINLGDQLHVQIESPAGVSTSLNREVNLTVDRNGKISLGSRYGSTKVEGLWLDEAEQAIFKMLEAAMLDLYPDNPTWPKDLKKINVRLQYEEKASSPFYAQTVNPYVSVAPPAESFAPQSVTVPPPAAEGGWRSIIRPKDYLSVEMVWPGSHRTRTVLVDAEGNIALGAEVGRVDVANKTIADAEEAVRQQIGKSVMAPQETVKVQIKVVQAASTTGSPDTSHRNNAQPSVPPDKSSSLSPLRSDNTQPLQQRIAPGDRLRIESDTISQPLIAVVEADGKAQLSLIFGVRRIELAGKTLTETEDAIKALLKPEYKDPTVQVTFDPARRTFASEEEETQSTSRALQEAQAAIEKLKQEITRLKNRY